MQAVTVRVHQGSQRANSGQNRISLQKKPALRVPPEKPFESVADRVFEKLQAQIGRSAIKAVLWLLTVGVTAVLVWLGVIKLR